MVCLASTSSPTEESSGSSSSSSSSGNAARDYLQAAIDNKIALLSEKNELQIVNNPGMPADRQEALRGFAEAQRADLLFNLGKLTAAAEADPARGLPLWLRESESNRAEILSAVIRDRDHERSLSTVRGIHLLLLPPLLFRCVAFPSSFSSSEKEKKESINLISSHPGGVG